MPELPDLEIIKEVLSRHLIGQRIEAVEVLRPIVLRILEPGITAQAFLEGKSVTAVARRGKFLLLTLDDGAFIAINPMLAGRLHYCPRGERARARDYMLLHLADGMDLRYNDAEGMGKIYLTRELGAVPGYAGLGPEALDPALTLEDFSERLRQQHDEIKDVLTRGTVIAGIGSAYADEILFRAFAFPPPPCKIVPILLLHHTHNSPAPTIAPHRRGTRESLPCRPLTSPGQMRGRAGTGVPLPLTNAYPRFILRLWGMSRSKAEPAALFGEIAQKATVQRVTPIPHNPPRKG